MKIYTDLGNINAFKLLVAAELKSTAYELVLTKTDEKLVTFMTSPRLPVLELDNTVQIFAANAAARYLFRGETVDDLSTTIDEWLEWEVTQLQPVVYAACIHQGQHQQVSAELVTQLQKLLTTLEQTTLNNPHCLLGTELCVADIVVWCSIYPLLCTESPLSELAAKYVNIEHWFRQIEQLPAVSRALSKLPGGISYDVVKTSFRARPVTLLPVATAGGRSRQPATASSPTKEATLTEVDSSITLPSVMPEDAAKAEAAWNSGTSTLPVPKQREYPLLPQEGERNILITSALPYVNNVPHLGNIIGCVLSADVFARFCRLRNLNTLYICGTDEYGTATETKAMEEGLTPQQICDKYNKLHAEIYQWFNIQFDHFGRTTTQKQTDIAQDIFWKLYNNGYILKDTIEQLLCEQCNRFLADRFVEGICPFCTYEDARGDQCDKCGKLINAVELRQPRCKQCKNTPVVKTSEHLFMDLPKLQPLLEKHLDENFEKGVWTSNTKVISKSWIRDGLKPRCISRDLKWGTPVPLEGYTDKVFYVWYDAPIGYISITATYTDQWQKWWLNPQQVDLYNFMAKDNVPFHSVIFPSTLLGTGDNWTVVNHLSATEYLNYEDGKFSKSRGVGVFGSDAMGTDIPADVWRFYLLYLRPESQDSAFSWDDFMLKNNSELLNNLGNFINRGLMFVNNNFGAKVPPMVLLSEDKDLLALVTKELNAYIDNLTNIKLRDGIRNILTISRYGNQYMQAHKPWVKVKGSTEDKARAGTIVGLATNIACLLSVMVQPYMPAVSQTIQTQLNAPSTCNILQHVFVPYLLPGHHIGQPSPLFQKIEASTIESLKKRFAGEHTASAVKDPQDVAKLEKAIADQGGIVRELKAAKGEKSKIDEEVKKLLDLKKQLAAAQGPSSSAAGGGKNNSKQKQKGNQAKSDVTCGAHTPADPAAVERLTTEIATQGNIVRQLKSSKAEKSKIDQEVAKLLDLKKQLLAAQGANSVENSAGGKKNSSKKTKQGTNPVAAVPSNSPKPADSPEVERLTKEVADQGNEVRRLKAEKVEKTILDAGIAKLIDLKRHLATAQGLDPDAVLSSGGSKKKEKKK